MVQRKQLPRLAALLLIVAGTPLGLRAQEERPTLPPDELFEVVDVEIVNIDVWVTNKKGDPIEGLEREDFVVLRDGLPTELANFYAVEGGRPVEEPEPEPEAPDDEEPELALERLSRDREPMLPPEHRLWLVIFVDNYNIHPLERDRVLPAVQSFVSRSLQRGDRAMIVTFDRSLEVRRPFTDDRAALLATLEELSGETGFVTVRRREQKELMKRIAEAEDPRLALLAVRAYAEEVRSGVDITVQALERLVESLAGLPGRKAFLHVSSGIPMLAAEEMFHLVGERFGTSEAYAEVSRYDTTRAWERVDRAANAHRVVFYTLDAGGLRSMMYGTAEYAGLADPRLRWTMDSVAPQNLQASLRLMAQETGGRAIVNQNEVLPALDKVREDFRTFYSLGITSTGVDSARYHEIEVRLRNEIPGATVRHRGAYRSKSQETRMRERLRAALFYEHEHDSLGMEVRWGRPERQDDGLYLLPVRLSIPVGNLALLPVAGGRHEIRLELLAGAAGGTDEISEIEANPLGLRIADENVEAARAESFVHTHRLLVGPGRRKVGIGVLDVFGQEWSVGTAILDIGGG